MEKNEINIINDLDKENDDLMTHLGILQQLSLGEKTNVLKQIKAYDNEYLDNDNINKIKEDKNFENSELNKKNDINNENNQPKNQDEKISNYINNKNELDVNKIKQEEEFNELNLPENNKNYNINSTEKNEINDDYKIFKQKQDLFFNINNKKIEKKIENNSSDSDIDNKNENIKSNNIDIDNNKNKYDYNNLINNKKEKFDFLKEENDDDPFNKGLDINNDIFDFKKYEKYLKNNDSDIIDNNEEKKNINIIKENTKENNNSNIKIVNQENKTDNFICDLDIFKKLQIQMNKKSEILQKTIDKYNHKPKKIEIINETKLNENNNYNYPKEKNIINDDFKEKNGSNINSLEIDINDINEKMYSNTQNLLEKINKIKNSIDIKDNNKINNYKPKKINNDKDTFIKKEIKSAQSSYEPLIFRIPSLLLDDKIEEIEIYIKLEMIYYNLKTITSKLDFISLLRQVLNNVIMLKNSSLNVFLQLFNFILSLQIYELNLSDCNPSLPCEYLKSLLDLLVNNKDLTEMIRIIIVLIKKYFPINMNVILEQKNIVTLKVLNSYLKELNNAILSAYINIKSIFIEINDFLFFSPPSLLSDEFPLAELYMEIYQEIRNTTDNIIKSCRSKIMKNELMEAVVFVKSKIKNSSVDYAKYLDYAIYKIN